MKFNDEEINDIKKNITDLLSDKKARELSDILRYLKYDKSLDEEIVKIINQMVDEYDLYLTKKGRYLNFKDSDLANSYYKGIFMATKSEFGFVRIVDFNEDIYIHESNVNNALDGDLVLVNIISIKNDLKKSEGKIVKILKRNKNTKIGEVIIVNNLVYCLLKSSKKQGKIELVGDIKRLVDGDVISIELIEGKPLKAKFKSLIGHKNDPGIEISSVLAEHDFEIRFSDEALEQLKTIPTEVNDTDLKGRVDLRNEFIFTIDGDDTKDIDDAISCKKLDNGNYELGVHIANVPYYIKENTPLDIEARKRGTSVYLVDRVVPMYPHQISNGICSLNPNVDRLTISAIMEINSLGNVVDYKIVESVINSKKQMTYKNVNKILEEGIIPDDYKEFADKLKEMAELAKIVRKNKIKRGYIDFEIDEVKILVDETGNVLDITKRYRGTGEKMIEDFMILANEAVSNTISNLGLIGIYRIHGDVSIERLRKFLKVLSHYNIKIKDDFKNVNQKNIQDILDKLKNLKCFSVLATKMISCMDKAKYSTNNIGHFALASRNYTHFTSPIRRYPDTTIHRLLHDYLFSNLTNEVISHWENVLDEICLTSSERERAAMECERIVDDMEMASFMENHIGEVYEGMVSGITSFGMYVMLPNLVEGMVRISDMKEKYYYDEEVEALIAANTNKIYTIGTEVKIKVLSASKETRQIDFIIDN